MTSVSTALTDVVAIHVFTSQAEALWPGTQVGCCQIIGV